MVGLRVVIPEFIEELLQNKHSSFISPDESQDSGTSWVELEAFSGVDLMCITRDLRGIERLFPETFRELRNIFSEFQRTPQRAS